MDDELMRCSFASIEVNEDFTAAVVLLDDQSRLEFRHGVDQRTIQAAGPEDRVHKAKQILERVKRFRLNGKHLDLEFVDGSRWELLFGQRPKGIEPSR
jgi:hypothetical protein